MSDERRERYAAEIYRRVACYPWDDISDHEKQHWYPYVDAAMSVADAELNAESVEWAKTERKLHAANEYLHDLVETLGQDKRLSDEVASKYLATIERLRKEHEVWGALARRNLERAHGETRAALATIERVRVMVDSTRPASKTEVLAALEGE